MLTSAITVAMILQCRVTSTQGTFHSQNPPQIGDSIKIDLESRQLGSEQKILFTRPGSETAPYIFGFLAKTSPDGSELARFGMSWTRFDGHLFATLTLNKDLSASLQHRWSPLNGNVEVSAMDLQCESTR